MRVETRVKEKPRVVEVQKVQEILGKAISELVAAKAQCKNEKAYQKYLGSAEKLIEEARRI